MTLCLYCMRWRRATARLGRMALLAASASLLGPPRPDGIVPQRERAAAGPASGLPSLAKDASEEEQEQEQGQRWRQGSSNDEGPHGRRLHTPAGAARSPSEAAAKERAAAQNPAAHLAKLSLPPGSGSGSAGGFSAPPDSFWLEWLAALVQGQEVGEAKGEGWEAEWAGWEADGARITLLSLSLTYTHAHTHTPQVLRNSYILANFVTSPTASRYLQLLQSQLSCLMEALMAPLNALPGEVRVRPLGSTPEPRKPGSVLA